MDKADFKKLLVELNLSQKEFAKQVGYTQQGVGKWVRDNAFPAWLPVWAEGARIKNCTQTNSINITLRIV